MLPAEQHADAIAEYVSRTRQRSTKFRLATEGDATFLLKLRLDPLRNQHISSTDSDLNAQLVWMRAYIDRFSKGREAYFIIEDSGVPIGSIRIYDYLPGVNSFCWGSWIIRSGAHPTTAFRSLILAYDLAFGPLGFTQARFDVRQANISVWKLHEKTGAKKIREDDINRYYEYLADDYQVARVWLKKFAQIKDTHEHHIP